MPLRKKTPGSRRPRRSWLAFTTKCTGCWASRSECWRWAAPSCSARAQRDCKSMNALEIADDWAIAVLQSMIQSMRERGRTIIMSTHQLREALELASHVALLQRGQIVHTGERVQQMVEDTGWLNRTYRDN